MELGVQLWAKSSKMRRSVHRKLAGQRCAGGGGSKWVVVESHLLAGAEHGLAGGQEQRIDAKSFAGARCVDKIDLNWQAEAATACFARTFG